MSLEQLRDVASNLARAAARCTTIPTTETWSSFLEAAFAFGRGQASTTCFAVSLRSPSFSYLPPHSNVGRLYSNCLNLLGFSATPCVLSPWPFERCVRFSAFYLAPSLTRAFRFCDFAPRPTRERARVLTREHARLSTRSFASALTGARRSPLSRCGFGGSALRCRCMLHFDRAANETRDDPFVERIYERGKSEGMRHTTRTFVKTLSAVACRAHRR
eukprot:3842647-Pleurochrysis_carterae.AAC.1